MSVVPVLQVVQEEPVVSEGLVVQEESVVPALRAHGGCRARGLRVFLVSVVSVLHVGLVVHLMPVVLAVNVGHAMFVEQVIIFHARIRLFFTFFGRGTPEELVHSGCFRAISRFVTAAFTFLCNHWYVVSPTTGTARQITVCCFVGTGSQFR